MNDSKYLEKDCPDREKYHTKGVSGGGYMGPVLINNESAIKTHTQKQCPTCHLWTVWVPKKQELKIKKCDFEGCNSVVTWVAYSAYPMNEGLVSIDEVHPKYAHYPQYQICSCNEHLGQLLENEYHDDTYSDWVVKLNAIL